MNDLLKEQITNAVNGIGHGWCSHEKAFAMAELIENELPELVVEIGVYGGRSLVPQALAVKHNGGGMVIGIDPWRNFDATEGDSDPGNKNWWASINLHDIHQHCMEALWRADVDGYYTVLRSASQHCAGLIGPIDILHLDGNHSETSSCRDVALYLPKLKAGGFLWFDDNDWATTQKALALIREQCDQVRVIGNCTLFKKR